MSEKLGNIADLDLLDRRILIRLDTDARQSYSQIAKALRQGRDRITYRVHRLLERGIIRNFVSLVNPGPLGETLYKSYIKLINTEENLERLNGWLSKQPKVFWTAECDGRWDYMYASRASTPEEFYRSHQELRSFLMQDLLEVEVFTLVRVDIFSRNYLVPEPKNKISFAHTGEAYEIDEVEQQLLGLLATNARIEIKDLAEHANTTPERVSRSVKNLEAAGVIVGYRPALDLSKLGMTFYKVLIYLKNYKQKHLSEFYLYCQAHPNVTFYASQIGSCIIELQVEAMNYWHMNEVVRELKREFPKTLVYTEIMLIRKEDYRWG